MKKNENLNKSQEVDCGFCSSNLASFSLILAQRRIERKKKTYDDDNVDDGDFVYLNFN